MPASIVDFPAKTVTPPVEPAKAVVDPAQPAEAPKEITAEEIEQSRNEFRDGFFSDKKKESTKEAPKAKEEPVAPPEAAKVEPEPVKKPKKVKEVKTEGLLETEEPNIDELSSRVAEKLKDAPQPVKEPEPEAFNDDERDVLEAAARLQNTSKYKGKNLVQETKEFWKREQDYAEKWETENPGEAFDPQDKIHAPFYKRANPTYTDSDLSTARELIRTDKLKEELKQEVRAEYEPEIQKIKAQEAYRVQTPLINQVARESVMQLVIDAVPDFKAMLDDGTGNLLLTQAAYDKMEDENPVAVAHLNNESHRLKVVVAELEKLDRLPGYVEPNINLRVETLAGDVYPHQEIINAGTRLEAAIASQPRQDQIFEGKSFITRGDLVARRNEILNSSSTNASKQTALDNLERKYWYVKKDDIRQRLIAESVRKIKPFLEASEKVRSKYKTNSTVEASRSAVVKEAVKPVKSAPISTPSTSSSSDSVNTQVRQKDQSAENAEELHKAMWS